jgi:hypothetical protein
MRLLLLLTVPAAPLGQTTVAPYDRRGADEAHNEVDEAERDPRDRYLSIR